MCVYVLDGGVTQCVWGLGDGEGGTHCWGEWGAEPQRQSRFAGWYFWVNTLGCRLCLGCVWLCRSMEGGGGGGYREMSGPLLTITGRRSGCWVGVESSYWGRTRHGVQSPASADMLHAQSVPNWW